MIPRGRFFLKLPDCIKDSLTEVSGEGPQGIKYLVASKQTNKQTNPQYFSAVFLLTVKYQKKKVKKQSFLRSYPKQ